MWIQRLKTTPLLAVLVLATIVACIYAMLVARPVINRAANMVSYLRADQEPAIYLESDLNAKVVARLSEGLLPQVAERLRVHRVPSWEPLPMDDPATRMETLRRVADATPAHSLDWEPIGDGEIRDAYALFLGELLNGYKDRSAVLAKSAAHLSAYDRAHGAVDNIKRREGAHTVATAASDTIWNSVFVRPIVWLERPVEDKLLAGAINDVWLTMTPNPADNFSVYPTLSEPTEDSLGHWFQSNPTSSSPVATAKISFESSANATIPSPQSAQVGTMAPNLSANGTAVLYARDWKVVHIKRPWFNEALLERFRRNQSPLFNIGWMFGDGPLSEIPYAVVVAREVYYGVTFSDRAAFDGAKNQLLAGKPIILSVGETKLVIPPDGVTYRDPTNSLIIRPTASRASILSIVTLSY